MQISCLHMANQGNVLEVVLLRQKGGKLNGLRAAYHTMKTATVVHLLRSKSCTILYMLRSFTLQLIFTI